MTPQQIIDDVFLLDKSITISFPSRNQFNSLRSQLAIYLKRMVDKCESLGMGDPFEGKRLITESIKTIIPTPIVDREITYKFSLVTSKPVKPNYTVLTIQDEQHN